MKQSIAARGDEREDEASSSHRNVDDDFPWHVPIPKAMREYLDVRWISNDQTYTYDNAVRTEDEYLAWYAGWRRAERAANV